MELAARICALEIGQLNVDRLYDTTEREYIVFARAVAERVTALHREAEQGGG